MAITQKKYVNTEYPEYALDILPVAGRLGAEVRGTDLSENLDGSVVKAIRTALARHKVLFFRDQTSLDDAGQEAFAARLGRPVPHPTVPVAPGSTHLLDVNSTNGFAASSWHTDVTFVPAYPEASILRALTIPQVGGDTLWANTATAYSDLPEPLRRLVDDLRAVHSNIYDYAASYSNITEGYTEHYNSVFTSTVYETEHPVVHVHPETGERNLLVGHFLKNIVGLNSNDTRRLVNILQEYITKPENTVRWRWRVGDVAIWDNRATQHRAIADFGNQRRHLRRITIAGALPIGIAGDVSRAIKPRSETVE